MDDNSLDRLFSGNLEKLAPLPKRVVRLFISSTFTDMTLERNTLMERVYPRMKKYCREKHGLDFQVVDMRWGVRDEATDDHQTVELCSREISNCRRVSLGPNFVALIGDKYGFRPLPSRIKSQEYRSLRRCLIESDINTDFLDAWYREDLNAQPAEYVLQPISSKLKNFTNKSEPDLQRIDQRIWQAIQDKLHELLLIGSQRLVDQGRMSKRDQLMKYSISVTEREVIEGCLDVSEPRKHCLVYVRSIANIREHLHKCLEDLLAATTNNTSPSSSSSCSYSSSSSPQTTSVKVVDDEKERGRDKISDCSSSSLQPPNNAAAAAAASVAHNPFKGERKIVTKDNNAKHRKASLKIGQDSIYLPTTLAQTLVERKIERTRRLLAKFIDLKLNSEGEWQLDHQAQEALSMLRDHQLKSRLFNSKAATTITATTPNHKKLMRNFNLFQVNWHEGEGICFKFDEHKKYLNELSEHFYSQLTRMIRNAVRDEEKSRKAIKTGRLIGEILQHSHYALQLGHSVKGRLSELDQIKQYILYGTNYNSNNNGNNNNFNLPMFVYGVSGCGKTSVLARVATKAYQWIKLIRQRRLSSTIHMQQQQQQQQFLMNDNNSIIVDKWDREPCVIMRFCCTTPASSTMISMLTSICRQLQYNFYQFGPLNGICTELEQQQQQQKKKNKKNKKKGKQIPINGLSHLVSKSELAATQLPFGQIPSDFVRLVFTFRQLLNNCRHPLHRKRLFVIILDSIERLSFPIDDDIRAKYSWLTKIGQLPANVRLIVSCSSLEESANKQTNDFYHLKRHFLRAYYNQKQSNLQMSEEEAEAERDDDENVLSDSIDLSEPLCSSYTCAPVVQNENTFSKTTSTTSQQHLPFDGSRKYRMLKRILMPAVRFVRNSRGNSPHDQRDTATTTRGQNLISWSPNALDMNNFSRSNLGQARASIMSSGGGATDEKEDDDDDEDGDEKEEEYHFMLNEKCFKTNVIGMLHIKPLGSELARKILCKNLNELGRNLTLQQWSIVERSFSHCSRPIFIKLTLGEVLHWKSYSTQGDSRGLTFGSAWLSELKLEEKAASNSLGFGSKLCKFIELDVEKKFNEESETFLWQTLTMEQQWLNYLDYQQRKLQNNQLNNESSLSLAANNSQQSSANFVIHIKDAAKNSIGYGGGGGGDDKSKNLSSTTSPLMATDTNVSSSSLCHLSDTIEDAICQLFVRIELQHGYLLTKHSLSYISVAHNGLCENELEDILSLDDVVLDDVFQYHLPPIRRIPPLLWTRIRNDLNDYLSERNSDGLIVIGWHYKQFKLVTKQRYLNDSKQVAYIHSIMADYFLGKWADRAKPFRCTKQQIFLAAEQLDSAIQAQSSIFGARDSQQSQTSRSSSGGGAGGAFGRLGSGSAALRSGHSFSVRNRLRSSDQHEQRLQWMQAKADRRVAQQPLYYINHSNSNQLDSNQSNNNEQQQHRGQNEMVITIKRHNLRKLIELPFHLIHSKRFQELASTVLFNYQWLLAAINSIGLQTLFIDIAQSLASLSMEIEQKRELLENGKSDEFNSSLNHSNDNDNNGDGDGDEIIATNLNSIDTNSSNSLESFIKQLTILNDTLRLAASVINLEQQMLAPQLLGRLLSIINQFDDNDNKKTIDNNNGSASQLLLVDREKGKTLKNCKNWLRQLLEQCDQFGCYNCSLLPVAQCFPTANGLQLSSLESHTTCPFGITSIVLTADHRHLLTSSKKFLMWDMTTGEIVRDFEPPEMCSCIRGLKISLNNEIALAFSRENNIIALNIQTQQVSLKQCSADLKQNNNNDICDLKLIDSLEAKSFLIWTENLWKVFNLIESKTINDYYQQHQQQQQWITIEQEYEFNLQFFDYSHLASMKIYSIDIERNSNIDLTFLILCKRGETENEMKLMSLEVNNENSSSANLWLESHKMSAKLLCLCDNLKQMIYAQTNGDIYLRRRRVKSWSAPKLLRRTKVLEKDVVTNLRSMLALEVETSRNSNELIIEDNYEQEDLDWRKLAEFEEKLEEKEEGVENKEIESNYVFKKVEQSIGHNDNSNSESKSNKLGKNNFQALKFIKIYMPTQLIVIQIDKKINHREEEKKEGKFLLYKENCCILPRNIQNVSIDDNKCQTMSLIMEKDSEESHYLIISATRRILIYMLENEQLLENIDAHEARITKLLPITINDNNNNNSISLMSKRKSLIASSSSSSFEFCLVSSSMDKTVKIWNLANIGKQRKQQTKLNNAIETMHLAKSMPLVLCITRGHCELGLWDWSKLELISHWMANDFSTNRDNNNSDSLQQRQKFTFSKFSSNEKFISITTLNSLVILTIDKDSSKFNFVKCLEQMLPENLIVLKTSFILQDSMIIVIGRYPKIKRNSMQKVDDEEIHTNSNSSQTSTSSSFDKMMTRQVVILCYSVPFGQLIYSIELHTLINFTHTKIPRAKTNFQENNKQFLLSSNDNEKHGKVSINKQEALNFDKTKITKPILSSDQQYIVALEYNQDFNQTLLSIYNICNGIKLKSIALNNLIAAAATTTTTTTATSNADKLNKNSTINQLNSSSMISIDPNQITKLKSIKFRNKFSFVALINEEENISYLIDFESQTSTQQSFSFAQMFSVIIAKNWNCKLTSDGRYGLSARAVDFAWSGEPSLLSSAQISANTTNSNSSGGIHLLDTRYFKPIKLLITKEKLYKLSNNEMHNIVSKFTELNDDYVYMYSVRSMRILLIRLRDTQIIADYKSIVGITKVKCTKNGSNVLVVGHLDGTISSLAIVDPQETESLARLTQFPSRKLFQ